MTAALCKGPPSLYAFAALAAFLFAANMTEQQIHKDIMYHFPDFAKIIEEEQDT